MERQASGEKGSSPQSKSKGSHAKQERRQTTHRHLDQAAASSHRRAAESSRAARPKKERAGARQSPPNPMNEMPSYLAAHVGKGREVCSTRSDLITKETGISARKGSHSEWPGV